MFNFNKITIAILLFLIFLPLSHAQEKIENFNDYQSLNLNFHIEGTLITNLQDPSAKLDEMRVDLSFFPRENDFQKIDEIHYFSDPISEISKSDQYTTYTWKNIPNNINLKYGIDAKIKTSNIISQLSKSIKFPINNIDPEFLKYTKASQFIDITQEIEQQALSITGSETDLFAIVFKLADWTKTNVKYDLSTLTAEAVQKSSWVLANKEGVCDEITNLFISMLRSLGIPARFVSGMVYSNTDYKWGPHGWAEVYFPGYGWIPFDVTFGQYGWLDPSHVKLKDSTDSGSSSAEYSWKSTGQDKMDIKKPILETTGFPSGKNVDPFIKVEISPYRKAVSPGSVVPLFVTLENQKNVYFAPVISVVKAPGIIGANTRQVLLHPKESKTIAFLLQIPSEAVENYIYTSKLEVITSFGNIAMNDIKYSLEYSSITEKLAREIASSLDKKSEKSHLDSAAISCSPEKQLYYKDDSIKVSCSIKNIDNQALSLNACLQEKCQQITLSPKSEKTIEFSLQAVESGRFTATLENEQSVAYAFVPVNVIKVPDISIADVNPKTVEYGDEVKLSFTINTDTPISKVIIDLGFDKLDIESIESSKEINILTHSKNLIKGLPLTMSYSDAAGKVYNASKLIKVQVNDVPWYARFIFWIVNLF